MKYKKLFERKFTEIQIQNICNIICNKLNIPEVQILPLEKEYYDYKYTKGIYDGKCKGFYRIRLKNESDIKTVLHELCHHVQMIFYHDEYETPHDKTFTKALGRVTTILRKTFGKEIYPYSSSVLR